MANRLGTERTGRWRRRAGYVASGGGQLRRKFSGGGTRRRQSHSLAADPLPPYLNLGTLFPVPAWPVCMPAGERASVRAEHAERAAAGESRALFALATHTDAIKSGPAHTASAHTKRAAPVKGPPSLLRSSPLPNLCQQTSAALCKPPALAKYRPLSCFEPAFCRCNRDDQCNAA